MIDNLITFTVAHPIITGILIGASGIGGPLGIIGWCLGYDHAMRKVDDWMRPIKAAPKLEPIHGDVPNLPPLRERRFSAVQHREWMS